MLCDPCHGKGLVARRGAMRPCGECGGFGTVHCCEGLIVQPSAEIPLDSKRQEDFTMLNPNRGAAIRYTVVSCSLGKVLLAGTDHGVCMVSLGGDEGELLTALGAEYPACQLRQDDSDLAPWAGALLRYLDGTIPHLDLPLDVKATTFQRRVWDALKRIPYGTTATYSEIARRLGQPEAARAVGHACATNPVSLVIPCHRVVREDGGLGGYRWGLDRKQALLNNERKSATIAYP